MLLAGGWSERGPPDGWADSGRMELPEGPGKEVPMWRDAGG